MNYYDYANSISYETSLTDTSSAAYAEWDKAYGDGSNGLPQYNCFSDSYAVSSIRVAGSNCIEKVFQAQEGGFDFTTEFLSSELNQLQDGVTVNVLTDNGVDTIPYTVFTYTMEGCTMDLYYLDGATPEYIIIY